MLELISKHRLYDHRGYDNLAMLQQVSLWCKDVSDGFEASSEGMCEQCI